MTVRYATIRNAYAKKGLSVRGGFALAPGEMPDGVAALVLLGNIGDGMWSAFAAERRNEPDPLDAWTKRVVEPIAYDLGAHAVYPSDRPYRPFQQWAQRAEAVYPSPLGILMHPDWGLWHAYRAALLFDREIDCLPARDTRPSPCESCIAKPCLTACPVSAFDGARYDVAACGQHLLAGDRPHCADLGCRARDACPVAAGMRYPDAQIRFHMAAFVRSRESERQSIGTVKGS